MVVSVALLPAFKAERHQLPERFSDFLRFPHLCRHSFSASIYATKKREIISYPTIVGPTHDCGHTLDVLITCSDQIINSINVDPPLLSDHSLIVASVDIHVSQKYNVSRQARRSWRSLDVKLHA